MKKIRSILFTLSVGILFVPDLSGASSLEEEERSFKAADLNHDGRLTWPEFEQAVRKILSIRDNFQARAFQMLGPKTQETLMKEHFASMDKDHKGYLLLREWHQ